MEGTRPNVKSHMVWSIMTTLCCCLPLGVAAIICSRRAEQASMAGDASRAEEASRKAKILNIIGLVCGIVLIILIVALQLVAAKQLGG